MRTTVASPSQKPNRSHHKSSLICQPVWQGKPHLDADLCHAAEQQGSAKRPQMLWHWLATVPSRVGDWKESCSCGVMHHALTDNLLAFFAVAFAVQIVSDRLSPRAIGTGA